MPAVGMGVVDVWVFAVGVRVLGVSVVGYFVHMAVEEGEPDQDDEHSGGYAQPGVEFLGQDVARQVECSS